MKQTSPPPVRGIWYLTRCILRGQPRLVNLEITKRCNARCTFCSCWQVGKGEELADYSDVIKKFRPVVVSVSGGEPLLRKDYAEVLTSLRPYCHYLGIITNGVLLNEESAKKLARAGVNHTSVSLDYLGTQHDEARKVSGLYDHLATTIPHLSKLGHRIVLNTIIMDSNLDEILPIAYRAKEWGAMVSFSAYCSLKKDQDGEMVRSRRHAQLVGICSELKALKRTLGHIRNSDYYLDRVPGYFRDGRMANCQAGYRWVQVTPDGYVQQCSELPRVCHYSEYDRSKIKPSTCEKCWYTCRGEAEAPWYEPRRMLEFIKA